METPEAVLALTALAHETRLTIFQCLIAEGPNGMAAGDLAKRLNVIPATLSFHLKELDRAGLLRSWRRKRHVYYAVSIEGMRQLLTYLTRDCCQGHPEICGDLMRSSDLCALEDG